MIYPVDIESFNEGKILEILDKEIEESTHWDFKEAHYNTSSNSGKKDFVRDISAMANGEGGVIVIGIDDSNELKGVEIDDFDKLKLQLTQVLRSNTDPSISGVLFKRVNHEGRDVYALFVPSGNLKPYSVSLSGTSSREFMLRQDASNHHMSIQEIKFLFNSQPSKEEFAKNSREWIEERIEHIFSPNFDHKLDDKKSLLIHILPKDFYSENELYSVTDIVKVQNSGGHIFAPFSQGWSPYPKQDCVFSYNRKDGDFGRDNPLLSYVSIFTNGAFEIFDSTYVNWLPTMHGKDQIHQAIDSMLFDEIEKVVNFLNLVGKNGEFLLSLTFMNLKGFKLERNGIGTMVELNSAGLSSDKINVTCEIDLTTDYINQLKPFMDKIWNAFGISHCHRYDENGIFIG